MSVPEPPPAKLELLLIRNEPSCRKCHKTEAVLREVAESHPAHVSVRVITADTEEAHRYGALITPMVLLNGKVACAGMVPRATGLRTLVEAELRGASADA